MKKTLVVCVAMMTAAHFVSAQVPAKTISWSPSARQLLEGKQILYIERAQYAPDHHNTETLFQAGEINTDKFEGGSAMRVYDVSSKTTTTLLESHEGVIRDPEVSYDGRRIVFSMRSCKDDYYHIYEINADGTGLRQLTFAEGVSDIDPVYLPDGGIAFSSTRQPKYCMCNRHIMANLYRMDAGGKNITQLGISTLFEGHGTVMGNGQILYDRWEYVDRNFGDAQGLWTVNPDGTKHEIYYGNNTQCPGGVIDGRQIPGTDLVVCIFGACHELPWGALAVIDRKRGVDGEQSIVHIMPENSRELIGKGDLDSFKWLDYYVEDPYPVDENNFLVSRTIWFKRINGWEISDSKSGIYLMDTDGHNELLLEGNRSLFDPIIIEPRPKPHVIPAMRDDSQTTGIFYVQNVYNGTHMKGVGPGAAKYLRVIETPEKRTWTISGWGGQGEQAPAVNWHSFETKRILGDVPIEEDGSVNFTAPAYTFVYFQLLDENKKMIQSMRSGTMLMPGETNGCIGCHEDRISAVPSSGRPKALSKKPVEIEPWKGKDPVNFSFAEQVQPILDRHCVKCHDFDNRNRDKLVLAGDKNMFFNAAYVNLYVNKAVTLIGGGPAQIQQPYDWGSHASKLTRLVDGKHRGVNLTQEEKETLYTWMDLNGVYYPVYESAFDNTLAGRSPLTYAETDELAGLTGVNFHHLNNWQRTAQAQVSFDRPEKSPCLDGIRGDRKKYNRAVEIIRTGQKRLQATPRGDVESELVVSDRLKGQLRNYIETLQEKD